MQKALIVFMMFLLGFGLVQPSGFVQSCDLRTMYNHCAAEDPDITPLDFVFEHLLNLEDVMHYFEGENEEEEGEQPHQPFQIVQSTVQYVAAVPKSVSVSEPIYQEFFTEKIKYPLSKEDFYNCNFCADIFHPPIV